MSSSPDTHDHSPGWLKARIADVVWRVTPKCKEVARLTSDARERPLSMTTRLRLGLHKSFCEWCARYAAQLDLLGEATQHLPEHMDDCVEEALPPDAKARMKQALRGK